MSLLLPHRLFVVFALNVTDVRALCGFVLCDDRIELADSRNGGYARRQNDSFTAVQRPVTSWLTACNGL